MTPLDLWLFAAINAATEDWGPVASIAFLAAKFVVYLIPVHLVLLWLLGGRAHRRLALTLLAALLIGIAISYAIGFAAPTARPFQVPVGHLLIEHRGSPSFPSNHGLVMFTYAATLALAGWRRLAIPVALAAVAVAWSRIYLGVHFPFDMIGALAIALPAAWLAVRLDAIAGGRSTEAFERAYLRVGAAPDRWVKRIVGTGSSE